jgi:hypothetical protein
MGGDRCPRRVRSRLAGVRDPQIQVRAIALRDARRRAVVRVRTELAGRRPLAEALELRLVEGEWRLEALR